MKILRVIGRVILYLLAGIGVVTAAFVIGVVTFALTARDAPSPPDRMVLAIDLGRGIVERDRPDVFQSLTRTGPLVLRDTLEAIAAATNDARRCGDGHGAMAGGEPGEGWAPAADLADGGAGGAAEPHGGERGAAAGAAGALASAL